MPTLKSSLTAGRRVFLAPVLLAAAMGLGGCNTLGGAVWFGAYAGAETGTVGGMLGGAVIGAGLGLAADIGALLEGGHDHSQDDVAEYYYPCKCDECRRERGEQ